MKFWLVAAASLGLACSASAQLIAEGKSGVRASVSSNGSWSVYVPNPSWNFTGQLGAGTRSLRNNRGTDQLGAFEEVAFEYSVGSSSRSASIRVYPESPVVLFLVTCSAACPNTSPFPTFSSWPQISHLSYSNQFAEPDYVNLPSESPWVFFDGAANSFILSSASDFMTSAVSRTAANTITSGISAQIATLPAGFSHQTILAFGTGINATFDQWGAALTTLSGKQRPSNDADPLLKSVSYWTDNGATYYYNPGGSSYADTLQSVKAEFNLKGIRLGSLQLDSWWYPKGPDNNWSSHSGIWTYDASPSLFPQGLAAFQNALGTSLVTHARWIDANSPYRSQYAMSGNVSIDPKYWDDVADRLHSANVSTYEQDWLGESAHADFNLRDPYAFLGNMSASMAKRGLTVQYCMALPKHFLESSRYSNVTTVRTSGDRFGAGRYTHFFYTSRLATALGAWPFSDVMMSSETQNLIAATLSAGPVGVGDPVGQLSAGNLLKAVRADGVIVKPDVSAMPLDSIYIRDAAKTDTPMVASASTDHGAGMRANYLVAYPRGENTSWTVNPASFGITGQAYLFNFLGGHGTLIEPRASQTANLSNGFEYNILVPVGPSGIAFLGDEKQFVTRGRKRIAALTDDGTVDATVLFAEGETTRTLFGYSPTRVLATSVAGTHGLAAWDPTTQIFRVKVRPDPATGSARVRIRQAPAGSLCGTRCSGSASTPAIRR